MRSGVLLVALLLSAGVRADDRFTMPTEVERAQIAEWIPASCCRTHNCCFKIPASAIVRVTEDEWQVPASGEQRVPRTAWSQDGHTWRCACDGPPYLANPRDKTRCLFPQRGAVRYNPDVRLVRSRFDKHISVGPILHRPFP